MCAVDKQNIVEFDLEKFFDSVDLHALFNLALTKYGIPFEYCQQLLLLNMQLPKGLVLI